jgi:hypothetical protein
VKDPEGDDMAESMWREFVDEREIMVVMRKPAA